MMKKLLTILCSFVLCISLFGCQKETKNYIAKIEVENYGTIPSLTVEKVKSARKPLFKV